MITSLAKPAMILFVAILVWGSYMWVYNAGIYNGKAQLQAEQSADTLKRMEQSGEANDRSYRCSLDPTCRMRDDGYKRAD